MNEELLAQFEKLAKLGMNERDKDDLLRTYQNNVERHSKPHLPIMLGLLLPPYAELGSFEKRLTQYREMERHKKEGTIVQITNTLLAQKTHGIAPSTIGLQPITIKEAIQKVNTIHTGRVLFVKSVKECLRVVGTTILVADSNDDLITLNLYNYVSPEEDPQLLFPSGTYIAVLEPYLRFAGDNPKESVIIRTDNPQSIIIFESDIEWTLAKRGIFEAVQPTIPILNAESEADAMCVQGNKYYGKGEFKLALKYYNKGFQLFPSSVRILSNRAAAYMSIENWTSAQMDVDAVLAIDPSHTKCLYRRASIYLNLQQPNEAKKVLDILIQDRIDDKTSDCKADIVKLETLLRDVDIAITEQQGVYDLKAMMRESNHTGEGPTKKLSRNHMDYASPHIEMKHVKGKGNGMFSTTNFATSEIIMVEKALVFVQSNPQESSNQLSATTNFSDFGHSTKILPCLVQKLISHPDCGGDLYSLSAGSKYPDPVLPENSSKVDVLRMTAILTSNWFGAETNAITRVVNSQRKKGTNGPIDDDPFKAGTGLWLHPSRFNHSCMPNCTYFIIGDYHFIITNRPVSTDEELTITYCDLRKPFVDRCEIFKNWNSGDGFTCLCKRCVYLRLNPAIVAIDVEIEKAYIEATNLCAQGYSMGKAADKALSMKRRKILITQLEKLSIVGQGNLSKLYELEFASHACAGRHTEALLIGQKTLEAEISFFGIGPEFLDLLKAYLRVISSAMGLNDMELAKSTLMTVYTVFCSPPWGKITKNELKVLCQRYVAVDLYHMINYLIDELNLNKNGNFIDDGKIVKDKKGNKKTN
jgi:tetratricopeptide (TPR) repeat protein